MNVGTTIAGFGHYAPENRIPNSMIEERLGVEPGWIAKRTGIEARRYVGDDQALTDIALPAAEMALEQSGRARTDVALLLLATSTPDHLLPPSAPLLAHRLGLGGAGGIDLAGACGGFLYALTLADSFVRTHRAPVLVVGANVLSRRINPAERASSVLFADAAGAALLVPTDDPSTGVLGASLATDGSGYGLISIPAGGSRKPFSPELPIEETQMSIADGRAVFARATALMVDCARSALGKAGRSVADVDWLVPHQANERITAAVCRQLGVPAEKALTSIAEFGNSSAGTVPLTLSLGVSEERVRAGQTLLLCAAGAGLTGGGVVFALQ